MRIALVAVLLFALAGCAFKPDMTAKTVRYQADYPQYQTVAELFAAADLVAEVSLAGVDRSTAGQRKRCHKFTPCSRHRRRTYKGKAPARLEIKQGGGRHKGTEHIEVGSVSLQPKGHYLVFVEVYDDAPASLLNPTQGQYRLDDAGTLTPVDGAGLRFTLAELAQLTPRDRNAGRPWWASRRFAWSGWRRIRDSNS